MFEEFTKGVPMDKRPSEEEMRVHFKKLDTNGSGTLELMELVPLVNGILKDIIDTM